MKRIALSLVLVIGLFTINACQKSSGPQGQLTGVQDRPDWDNVTPYGMVYIESGTFHSGPSDQDVSNALIQRSKAISIQGFYMDDTEITNNEYRQMVHWVRDSIAHSMLGHYEEDDNGNQKLDWSWDIDWAADSEDASALTNMMYSGDDQFWGKRELDSRKLKYSYSYYDWTSAASKSGRANRGAHIVKVDGIEVYPDTLAWIHDFSYSYNEPMTRNYFWHPAFDDYPVVGVNWNQAMAFCAWRSHIWNSNPGENGGTMGEEFRLPFEHEWEYAARGGLEHAPYPWGGPYVRNSKGCLLANFKPGRGNYPEDGGFYTVKTASYHPNEYGLYDMAGNVAEWVFDDFAENATSFNHDMNPLINRRKQTDENATATMRRKVIRGGSWKDIAYYIQTGTRHWEYQDTSKSYIGFRSALTFLGRSANDSY